MGVNWYGVYPAVTTQFNDDESINIDATQTMLDRLVNEGVNGVVICGLLGKTVRYPPERSVRL